MSNLTAIPAMLISSSSSSSRPSSSLTQDQRSFVDILLLANAENMMNNRGSTTTIRSHGVISVIGRQRSMQDAFTVAPSLVHVTPRDGHGDVDKSSCYDLFAVYDGHGGSEVAHRCKERLHHLVAEEIVAEVERTRGGNMDWQKVMSVSFSRMDDEVATTYEETVEEAGRSVTAVGSTALVVVLGAEEVVVANCGDCRAVLCHGGAASPLSYDHKPDRQDEKERIESVGGNIVDMDVSRVQGVLAISRSIGDHYLKPYVISEPETIVYKRTPSDKFLIIATDGLWDMVPNEVAYELVRKCFSGQVSRKVLEDMNGNCSAAAATLLVELAMARGSRDNISVIVVDLQEPT